MQFDYTTFKRRTGRKLALSLFGWLLVALTALSGLWAPAHSGGTQEKVTLREAVIREGPNRIRAKEGFELIKSGKSEIAVRNAKTKEVIGTVKCSTCPGGKCTGEPRGATARCFGCGSDRDCVIDPF
jgi:hypothetical protein